MKKRTPRKLGHFSDIENSVPRRRSIELFQLHKKWHTRGIKPFDISSVSKIDPSTLLLSPLSKLWLSVKHIQSLGSNSEALGSSFVRNSLMNKIEENGSDTWRSSSNQAMTTARL